MSQSGLHARPAAADRHEGSRRSPDLPPLPLSPVRHRRGQAEDRIWRALQRASQKVACAEERDLPGDVAPTRNASELQLLCGAVQAAARGAPVSVRDVPEGNPGIVLVRSLRRAFLDELAQAGDSFGPAEIVRTLRAVDTVEETIEKKSRASSPISEADGQNLVVEVAHDMRSPLAAILFLVETISRERSGPVHPAHQRQLGLVYSAAFALSTLTNDLIDSARGSGSLLDGPPSPFSIAGVLCGVRDIILPMAEEKGLSLIMIPPEADWRVGHAAALHRVLLNLSTNALKFTDEGRVEVMARQRSRTSVTFSVTDTGRGLPSSILHALRQPKPPLRELGSRRFCSTGLGLSICRKLIEGMGGELEAESAPGEGTRFHFTLDLAPSARL